MKRFFQSFYGKISVVFLLLLLILGLVQVYITMQSASKYSSEVDQKLNLNLARDMALELRPLLQDRIDLEKIGERIHYMMVMNPKVEIYLLDAQGKIVAFFAEPGKEIKAKEVDLAPMKNFLKGTQDMPILGDDPRNPGRKKPFSAATLALGRNEQGYLYIIIGGTQYDSASLISRESYVSGTIAKGLVLSVAGAGIIGLILFAFLTKRIHSMSEVVKDFERGNYQRRIQTPSHDEIGGLAKAFNQMADTLTANIEELKRNDDLRRELVANVSHDLRSPLASIQGYLETILMKDEAFDPEERRGYLNIILRDTEMLSKLVHELFELSKLDAHQIQPKPEPFSLAELTQDVVMKYEPLAEKLQVRLEAPLEPNLPQVYADIGLVERALSNLIENALNYTPRAGTVKVRLFKHDSRVRTVVTDTGCGIPAEELPYIFDRFYSGKKKRGHSLISTGLGLAIAKKIIDLYDGNLGVESIENVGTTFHFDLKPAL